MASLEIPVRLMDLPYVKNMIDDFGRLIVAVVDKDSGKALEIAEELAEKYGEKKSPNAIAAKKILRGKGRSKKDAKNE